jgi:hypothetical protein
MQDRRRARVAQYAERINRALGLLRRLPPTAVLRTLARQYRVSPRQARRYVEAAQQQPEGLPVPFDAREKLTTYAWQKCPR